VSQIEMIPYMIRAIQELAEENTTLKAQLTAIIQRLAAANIA
jgi:hypothetical protein